MPSTPRVPKPQTEHMRVWAASLSNSLTSPAQDINWTKAVELATELLVQCENGLHHFPQKAKVAPLSVSTPKTVAPVPATKPTNS